MATAWKQTTQARCITKLAVTDAANNGSKHDQTCSTLVKRRTTRPAWTLTTTSQESDLDANECLFKLYGLWIIRIFHNRYNTNLLYLYQFSSKIQDHKTTYVRLLIEDNYLSKCLVILTKQLGSTVVTGFFHVRRVAVPNSGRMQ